MAKTLLEQIKEFKEKLPVNKHQLDVECSQQAPLYNEVGELVKSLKHSARVAKDHLEFVKAKIKDDMRRNPGKYGMAKTTVDAIEDACVVSEEYQTALTKYSEDQYLSDLGEVTLEATGQRKSLIRDAVTLFVHEYYMTSQDMSSQKREISNVSEEEILKHRRDTAQQRIQEDNEEDAKQ